jgi:hypothetical protein
VTTANRPSRGVERRKHKPDLRLLIKRIILREVA